MGIQASFAALPVVGISLALSMAPLVPIGTLLAEVVPAEKLGEANGVLAAAKSMSSILAYMLTAGVCQILIANDMAEDQWIFFVLAPAVSACMFPFAQLIRSGKETKAKQTGQDMAEPRVGLEQAV